MPNHGRKVLVDNNSKLQLLKVIAFISLAVLFSTNFWGANLLFFLDKESLKVVQVVAGVTGFLFLMSYFVIKDRDKTSMISRNGRYYSEEASDFIDEHNISEEEIEKVITVGQKRGAADRIRYVGERDNGLKIMVMLDKKGNVILVSS